MHVHLSLSLIKEIGPLRARCTCTSCLPDCNASNWPCCVVTPSGRRKTRNIIEVGLPEITWRLNLLALQTAINQRIKNREGRIEWTDCTFNEPIIEFSQQCSLESTLHFPERLNLCAIQKFFFMRIAPWTCRILLMALKDSSTLQAC